MDFSRFFRVRGAEALEVDDEKFGGAREGEAFCGFPVGAAVGAAPGFVAGEGLAGGVGFQTIVKGDGLTPDTRGGDFDGDAVESFVGR